MLHNVQIVMVKSRFPENVGMAARACANMGCGELALVDPELWDIDKARPLATPKGQTLLENIRIFPSLSAAIQESTLVIGTTARTGGWRRGILSPERAAHETESSLAEGGRVSLVFGPEDKGLINEEIELCHRLVTIPTFGASSLNVAQSILLLLYECARVRQSVTREVLPQEEQHECRRISAEEQERLTAHVREMLLSVHFLHGDNPDYFLMPWRRFLGSVGLRRHESSELMGICRPIQNLPT